MRSQGCCNKDLFHKQLRAMSALIPASALLIPRGDCNDQGGITGTDYKEEHGGCDNGKPDPDIEGKIILEYALP